jgi:hypothetical protein
MNCRTLHQVGWPRVGRVFLLSAVPVTRGQESYVKEEIGWGFFVGRPHLYLVDKEAGESEIQGCKLQQP